MKVLFVRDYGLASALIRWGTGEPCSHVALQFGPTIIESVGHGIIERDSESFRKSKDVMFELEPSFEFHPSDEAWLLEELKKRVGRPYDYLAMLYLAWQCLKVKFWGSKWPKNNPWGEEWNYLCTEVLFRADSILRAGRGIEILPTDLDSDCVTPFGLRNAAIEFGKLRSVNA